jgi:drug/metabolite transporter (DMT)-like permease
MTAASARSAQASNAKIVVAFLAVYLVWGTTFLGIRVAVQTIPPFLMSGLRFFLAGGVMLLVLLAQGGRFPTLQQWRSAFIVGGLIQMGGIGLISFAEQQLSSGLAALLAATIPLWMMLFEWLGFHSKRPDRQVWLGMALGFGGLLLLFAPSLQLSDGPNDLPGMSIALCGAMSFALGSLYARRAPLPTDSGISTASEMLAGGLLLCLLSGLAGEPTRLQIDAIAPASVLALVYLIVFGSIVGYTAYLWLLKTVDPAKASTNFYVNPVVAVFVGWLILDETVTLTTLAAAAIILLGAAVINLRR